MKSDREHAAIVPAYLGLRAVIAKAFARIHGQNLVNFGIVPLLFGDPADHDWIESGDVLRIEGLRDALVARETIEVHNTTRDRRFEVRHDLSDRQVRVVRAGGLINEFRGRQRARAAGPLGTGARLTAGDPHVVRRRSRSCVA